jgi:hypothetical protein
MTPLLTGVFASQISGHLNTFTPTGSYDALATYTVGAGGVSSITFAGLPTGGQYTHLQIRGFLHSNLATYGSEWLWMTFNSDSSSNYSNHYLFGNGASASASGSANASYIRIVDGIGAQGVSNLFCPSVIDILDFSNTSKYKTVRTLSGADFNGTVAGYAGNVGLSSGSWRNTSAINLITLTPENGSNFTQYSQVSIYGVKG